MLSRFLHRSRSRPRPGRARERLGSRGGAAPPGAALALALGLLLAAASEALRAVEAVSPPPLAGELAVAYPELPPPYSAVFATILEGIQRRAGEPRRLPLAGGAADAALLGELRRRPPRALIALGRRGLLAARSLPERPFPVVVGAVLLRPEDLDEGMVGLSLAPEPGALFRQLRALVPAARRVAVVYDPRRSGWLVERAEKAAAAAGLTLEGHRAGDLREAARIYRDLLRGAPGDGSLALWLPPDATTVDGRVILPLVLREAWRRNVPVFAGNPAYAKRGVLFALYPDNEAMGRRLAELAMACARDRCGGHSRLRPLTELRKAINLRTASHLGIRVSIEQQREFALLFPAP